MKSLSTIMVMIIIVAIVAVVLNKQAGTVSLLNSFSTAFSSIVKTAVGPVS